jgi:two-component system phosphate regulon response regulator PhoB
MARKTVLVVDDERDLVDILEFNLLREQYRVLTASDGEGALAISEREVPDLILLDLMLPGIGGLEVCRRLRANPRTTHIPIVMLTAKGEETDAVIGLAQGADDYVRKPFGVKELMARVAAQLRRGRRLSDDDEPNLVRWGDLVIDSDRFVATLGDESLPFTTTEFKLLRHLVARKGRVFTRSELLDAVRGADAIAVDRTIDVHVAAVRRKLGEYGSYLITVRGVGYKFAERPEGAANVNAAGSA